LRRRSKCCTASYCSQIERQEVELEVIDESDDVLSLPNINSIWCSVVQDTKSCDITLIDELKIMETSPERQRIADMG
jgi:hypothetical protein